jgi:hypothetical protein
MRFYILASFFILVSIFVETSQEGQESECLSIASASNEKTCYDARVSNTQYSCVLNIEEKTCVEIKKSECNSFTNFVATETPADGRRRLATDPLTEEDCKSKKTWDDSKYNCVLKNENRCIEEGKSECLKESIYKFKRRLSTVYLKDENCKDLKTTSDKKKCVANEDGTRCDEVNFSYGLNLNKLSLFVFSLLFFL